MTIKVLLHIACGVLLCVGFVLTLSCSTVWAQERITDQVAVTVNKGRVLGIHRGEGIARIPLAAGEDIVDIQAKGVTGFVQTSLRLLGYSGTLQRWSPQELEVSEQVVRSYVTPRLILVVGEQRIYGFQGEIGRWKVQELRPRETLRQVIVKDHVAVLVTANQALGFSAFTGGFFSKDLPHSQDIITNHANDNIVILTFNDRQLLFRSGLAIWAELR
ncbi:MAG: hypothetical protein NPIRA04_30760 [Nitrospirales bacterium]|nr:MAG: hypothetical protein NPIRA04_30760 [Nitrospirales bacterium]